MKTHSPWGGLAINVCGDFLQLPPVSKDGRRKSMAQPLDDTGMPEPAEEPPLAESFACEGPVVPSAEGRQGLEMWRSFFRRVVCLNVNVRAPGVLSRLQAEMRAGSISDEMWEVYMSRVLQPKDPRLSGGDSPFAGHDAVFIVHRHKIRVTRSLERAREKSAELQTPLYVVQARDEAVQTENLAKLTPLVCADLLRRVNPEQTKGLPSFLPLYRGMKLILSGKDCVRFGIVKGCPVTLRDIVLSDDEIAPYELVAGQPHQLGYMPISLLLQAEKASWTLAATDLPADLPQDIDRRGLFQLRPSHDYLRVAVEDEYMSVRRTSMLVTPADTITVYAAQGATFDLVVADMQKPPNLGPALHWLACYVMLSRARSLEGFFVLRPATRKELSARPPKFL